MRKIDSEVEDFELGAQRLGNGGGGQRITGLKGDSSRRYPANFRGNGAAADLKADGVRGDDAGKRQHTGSEDHVRLVEQMEVQPVDEEYRRRRCASAEPGSPVETSAAADLVHRATAGRR